MTNPPVLYLGDTALSGAACYLAGLLTHWGYGFDYVPSHQPVNATLTDTPRRLFVLSDYPASLMDEQIQQRVLDQVTDGAGLVMIGGWESFHGLSGHWNDTPLSTALPVLIASQDDRINYDQPALVVKRQDHPITRGLPWNDRPPAIGGFNAVKPKPDATVVLEVQRYRARIKAHQADFQPGACDPLLVTGRHHHGRTAALMTDVAPHWVGPLVDWGDQRLAAQAPGGGAIEVGYTYAQFLRQLLSWTGRLNEPVSPGSSTSEARPVNS